MSAEEISRMTLEDLARMPERTVGTAIAAHFLEMDRYNVTLMARYQRFPEPLQSKCHFSGNRLHIVKQALLDYMGYKGEKEPI